MADPSAAVEASHNSRGPRNRGGASSPRAATSSLAPSSSQARNPPASPGSKRGRRADPWRKRASTSSRAAVGSGSGSGSGRRRPGCREGEREADAALDEAALDKAALGDAAFGEAAAGLVV